MKYHSDPNLESYIHSYKLCMVLVVLTTVALLTGLFFFVLYFNESSKANQIGFHIAEYGLFGMQLFLVPATIFFYIRLTRSFVNAKKLDQEEERPRSISIMIRESLLGDENARSQQQMSYFYAIYQKISVRFHVFFALVIGALLLRLYLYIVIRIPEAVGINPRWDHAIPPDHIYWMSI